MSTEAIAVPAADHHDPTNTNTQGEPVVTRTTPYDQLPEWMTAAECALLLDTSVWWVRQHINAGEIPHRRVGKLKFVPKSYFHASRATKAVAP